MGQPALDLPVDRIDLNLLNVFDVVMVERHVTRAADRLQMTQSAVSNALNRLRRLLGDQLFVKSLHGVDPTPRANELWPQIHKSIQELTQTIRPASFSPVESRNKFRISTIDLLASSLAPTLYKRIRRDAPKSSIHFIPQNDDQLWTRLSRGEVDIAFSQVPPSSTVLDAKPLWSEPFIVAARKGHPLFSKQMTLAGLCNADHVLINQTGIEYTSGFDAALAQRGLERNIHFSVNQFSVAATLLQESDLVAVVPARFAVSPFCRGMIATRPLPINLTPAVLYLIWHRRNNTVASHQWIKLVVLDACEILRVQVQAVIGKRRASLRED